MRIVLVTQGVKREDGQGRVNYEIALELLSRGHTIVLVAAEVASELLRERAIQWRRIRLPRRLPYLIRDQIFAAASTLALVRENGRADVIVVNGFVTWRGNDVNIVHFMHASWLRSPAHPRPVDGFTGFYRWLYTWLNACFERVGFDRARTIVAVSELVRRQLVDGGADPAKIAVVPNGVDLDLFRPGATSRRLFGMREGPFLALFAGDLRTTRKNLRSVLMAVAAVPDIHLAVAGDSLGSPYPNMARDLGIASRVHFLGLRRDIAALMQAADAFVLPSRFEPFGLVLLEASACGLPVITSREPGAAEALDADGMIVLDHPDDVSGLAAALTRLARDVALRERMGRAARQAAERLSWQASASRYAALIEQAAR